MVKILGKAGKSSGSPSGPGEFEQEFYATSSEAAMMLKELAQEIEAGGKVEATTSSWTLDTNPVQPIKLEIQYKPHKRELEIQIKLNETI